MPVIENHEDREVVTVTNDEARRLQALGLIVSCDCGECHVFDVKPGVRWHAIDVELSRIWAGR